jgi:hypothetical protein
MLEEERGRRRRRRRRKKVIGQLQALAFLTPEEKPYVLL